MATISVGSRDPRRRPGTPGNEHGGLTSRLRSTGAPPGSHRPAFRALAFEGIERPAKDGSFRGRQGFGKSEKSSVGVAVHGKSLMHQDGGVGTWGSNAGELDGASVHPAVHQSLVDQTVEDRSHRRVGILRKHIGHVAHAQLAVRPPPEDLHDSPLEVAKPRHATAAVVTAAGIAGAHRVVTCRGRTHEREHSLSTWAGSRQVEPRLLLCIVTASRSACSPWSRTWRYGRPPPGGARATVGHSMCPHH